MTRQRNVAHTAESWAAAGERLRAERAANPQWAAMDKAAQHTKAELAEIEAAKAKVSEAEATVEAAGSALAQAKLGMVATPTYDKAHPFSFFLKRPETYKAAAAAEPGLKADWEEARTHLTNANRRLNATTRSIDAKRSERRRAAKVANAPKAEPVVSRADPCQKLARKQAA